VIEIEGEKNMTSKLIATVFFLPLKDRPKNFPRLKNFRGKFWHTGIIFNDEIYECFSNNIWSISGIEKLKKAEFKNAVLLPANVDKKKLIDELKSGTDCAEYVARCIGLSVLKGRNKGEMFPEDIYNYLK